MPVGFSSTCSYLHKLDFNISGSGRVQNSEAHLAECITVISIVQFRPCEDMIPLSSSSKTLRLTHGQFATSFPSSMWQPKHDWWVSKHIREMPSILWGGGDLLIQLLRLTARLMKASQQHKACFDETKRREISIHLPTQKGLRHLTVPCDMSSAAQKQSSACLVTLVSHP